MCCLVNISPTQAYWELSYLNCVSLGILLYILGYYHQCNAAKDNSKKKVGGDTTDFLISPQIEVLRLSLLTTDSNYTCTSV